MPPRRCAGPGHEVVIYDNLSAGHRAAALGAPLIEGETADSDAVRRAIRESGATAVMHFAASLNVSDSVRDPAGYYRNNVIGTLGTLEAMAAEGCRLFVFSSSCAVYGEPDSTPIARGPSDAAGQRLRADEAGGGARAAAFRARLRHARRVACATSMPPAPIPTASWARRTTPRSTSSRARSRRWLAAPPLEVFGQDYPTPDGTCLRDYIHVSDLAAAHVQALAHLAGGGASATYNVGTETPTSVLEVMAAVERVDRPRRAAPAGAAPSRRSGGAVRLGGAHPARAGLDRGAPGARHDRRRRLALARGAPEWVRRKMRPDPSESAELP